MTALEIIKKSAIILNLNEILSDSSLNSVRASNEEDCRDNNFTLNRMFEILNIMLQDISTDYAQIQKEEVRDTTSMMISISSLRNFMKVLSVKQNGVSVQYDLINGQIRLPSNGNYTVRYLARATADSLLDEINMFNGKVGDDVLVYGLTALYCLAVGLFDEFNVYNSIYVDKLDALKTLKIINMPCRRWE